MEMNQSVIYTLEVKTAIRCIQIFLFESIIEEWKWIIKDSQMNSDMMKINTYETGFLNTNLRHRYIRKIGDS
jgi:hypothetical protein